LDFTEQQEAEERRKREFRREVIADWKKSAQTIRDENKKALLRESRREAVTILEDAARTSEEFEKVTIIWDTLEVIEEWRVEKWEIRNTDDLVNYPISPISTIIPPPLKHNWWKQLLAGKFLDLIYDCPHEIHELTSSRSVYRLTEDLDEKQKEILYYLAIRLWTPQMLAVMREQTDRNIRKVYNKMIEGIQQKLFEWLYPRYVEYLSLTTSQVAFIERYIKQTGAGKIRPKMPNQSGCTVNEHYLEDKP